MYRCTHDMWTVARGFSLDFPTGLECRCIHDNPGQAEPRLWGKLSWKMRRCNPTTMTGCTRRRVHRSWLPEVGSNIAERRIFARVYETKDSRTNQTVLTVNFFRCLYHWILGIFFVRRHPCAITKRELIDRKKIAHLLFPIIRI